jgi:hypothetical protein
MLRVNICQKLWGTFAKTDSVGEWYFGQKMDVSSMMILVLRLLIDHLKRKLAFSCPFCHSPTVIHALPRTRAHENSAIWSIAQYIGLFSGEPSHP